MADRDVLTHLPNARPTQRSAKRRSAGDGAASTGAGATKKSPAKPKATAAKAPVAKAKAPAKAKPAARKPAAPKAAAKAGGGKVKAARGQVAPKAKAPAPAREHVPGEVPPAGWASPEPTPASSGGFNTDDLAGTALTAVSQIVQIGVANVTGTAKSLLSRIPTR